jgi:hypothetical protein
VNYATLFSTVKNYLQNDFPAATFTDTTNSGTLIVSSKAQIDTFITQAETRIYNAVQVPALRKSQLGTTTPVNQYMAAPSDLLNVASVAVVLNPGQAGEQYMFLLNKDASFIREAFPSTGSTGVPTHYAVFGPRVISGNPLDSLTFMLAPTPDQAYTVELTYYYYPESITTTLDGTTWLSLNYDSVLLYGTLVEAYTFMKGEADMVAQYEKKYQEAMSQLNRLGTGLLRGDLYRSGQARIPQVNP